MACLLDSDKEMKKVEKVRPQNYITIRGKNVTDEIGFCVPLLLRLKNKKRKRKKKKR